MRCNGDQPRPTHSLASSDERITFDPNNYENWPMSLIHRSHKSSLSPDSTRAARAEGAVASCPARDCRSVPPRRCRISPMARVVWEGGSTHKLPLNRLRTRPDETWWPNRISGLHRMILPRETRRSGTRTGHRDDFSPRATPWPHVRNSSDFLYLLYVCTRERKKERGERGGKALQMDHRLVIHVWICDNNLQSVLI